MIFLPNNFERYCAALRNTVQLSIIKNGLKPKYFKTFKKIYEAEAFFSREEILPIDLGLFLHQLLLSAHIKLLENNRSINISLKIKGVFLINRKLFTALILNICQNSKYIKISYLNGKILIYAKCNTGILKPIITFLNGNIYFERKKGDFLITLPTIKTDKSPIKTEEWEYSQNPFSPVNIFIN